MTVLFITQNLFCQGNMHATLPSMSGMILFKMSGRSSDSRLGQQLYPGRKWQGFVEAYEDATEQPYGPASRYDTSHEELCLRTNIFLNSGGTIIYEPYYK